MGGTYILIASQTFLLQIKAYTHMKSNNLRDLIKICHLIQKSIPSKYSSLSGSKVQEVEEEQQVKLNRTPQEHSGFRYCCENFSEVEEQDVNMGTIDYCLGSSVILADFMDAAERVWNLGFSSRINYQNALQDLINFGKFTDASPNIVHNFLVSETFFKRARSTEMFAKTKAYTVVK